MDHDKSKQALTLMERALQLLDEADVPSDVGAHLDLATNLLQDALGAFGSCGSERRTASQQGHQPR